jgi:hypothetical protein
VAGEVDEPRRPEHPHEDQVDDEPARDDERNHRPLPSREVGQGRCGGGRFEPERARDDRLEARESADEDLDADVEHDDADRRAQPARHDLFERFALKRETHDRNDPDQHRYLAEEVVGDDLDEVFDP